MKQINTKFGPIFIEEFEYDNHVPAEREEEDRIKIYDSDERYLGYYSTETIETVDDYNKLCEDIENANTIEDLLDATADNPTMFYAKNYIETIAGMILHGYFGDETLKLLKENFGDWTDDVILSHDYTNRIGDYYIVVTDM